VITPLGRILNRDVEEYNRLRVLRLNGVRGYILTRRYIRKSKYLFDSKRESYRN